MPMDEIILFKGQHPDERVLLYRNRHFILFLIKLFKAALILGLLAFAAIGIMTVTEISRYNFYPTIVAGGLFIVYALYQLYIFLKSFVVVTDQRILIRNQKNLFSSDIQAVNLPRIKDVGFSFSGGLAKVLGSGMLRIECESELKENKILVFEYCPNVQEIKLFLDTLESMIKEGRSSQDIPDFQAVMLHGAKKAEEIAGVPEATEKDPQTETEEIQIKSKENQEIKEDKINRTV